MKFIIAFVIIAASAVPIAVAAHSGGLNAEGCHNDRKRGGYHCHRAGGGSSSPSRPRGLRSSPPSSGAFANCTAARAAGAAPVRRGDPGYGRHLDRDGDGVGCE
ncbi:MULTISPECIES: excalibur calcium-binding domain-containing protein [Brevundimonas]|uniref:Excalibur calcium-binding domain-containing protein n=2 Tax=Brevundimonas TaxID=41275 RepID=A0ABX8TJ75_9CAUL|nr:excalibur calcium-binding domain-containing protein [Brevundimonas sp. 'scallop']QSF53427.1 excalibur calcium-binding domain-containing protein [Brevundimonas fontaquae]QYC11236.1 excalibur calcium-binding domain-containing protein [Brevundimonas nasdae]QYC14023.1 excalibur calcium-binding domain-containing protein [Brevundimonas nasdae]